MIVTTETDANPDESLYMNQSWTKYLCTIHVDSTWCMISLHPAILYIIHAFFCVGPKQLIPQSKYQKYTLVLTTTTTTSTERHGFVLSSYRTARPVTTVQSHYLYQFYNSKTLRWAKVSEHDGMFGNNPKHNALRAFPTYFPRSARIVVAVSQ
jgi:hypothetical protein